MVKAQLTHANLEYAMIINQDGMVLAHTDGSKVGLYLTDGISKSLFKETSQEKVLINNEILIDVASSIHIGKKNLAGLALHSTTSFLSTILLPLVCKGCFIHYWPLPLAPYFRGF